jgi:hypothetical protein
VSEDDKLAQVRAVGASNEERRDSTPRRDEHLPLNPLTSELDIPGVMKVTAKRSLTKFSTKRSIDEQEDMGQNESPTNKKRKTRHVDTEPTDAESANTTAEGKPPKAKKGKLRPVLRLGTQESGETITVAQKPSSPNDYVETKSSPIVSVRSKRASKTPSSSATSVAGKPPKLLVSTNSIAKKPSYVKWLEEQGAQVIDKVPSRRTNFVCVIKDGELGTTAKILRSLALGKLVVTDKWVVDSKASGYILSPDGYVHDELQESMSIDRRNVFEKKHLYFTSSLVKHYGEDGWKNIEALAREAGASYVERGTPGKVSDVKGRANVIFFGNEKGDPEMMQLINVYGHTVYHKDMLTRSIITGELAVEGEEFELSAPASVSKGRRR